MSASARFLGNGGSKLPAWAAAGDVARALRQYHAHFGGLWATLEQVCPEPGRLSRGEVRDRSLRRTARLRGHLDHGEIPEMERSSPESRLDFLAVCLRPPYGLRGIEIKVDGADLSRELADPDKRWSWQRLVHEFYFAAPVALVDVDELPPECGLMEVGEDRRVRVVRQALEAEGPGPEDWPRMYAELARLAGKAG